jgi:hypothetical protein
VFSIPTIIYVIIVDVAALILLSIIIITFGIIALLSKVMIDVFDHYTDEKQRKQIMC